MSDVNLYKLLELDYDVDDYDEIQAAIKRKRAEWSRLLNNPRRKSEADANFDALKKIRDEDMKDPEYRRQQADEARQLDLEEQAKKERIKYANLDKMIAVISTKGWIEEAEIQSLMDKLQLSRNEIESRISLPIENKLTTERKTKRKKIEVRRAKKVMEYCEKLGIETNHVSGVASIYDFLQLSPTSSTEVLQRATEEKYNQIRNSSISAKNNLERDLQAECSAILRNDRAQYDKELTQFRLEQLEDVIKLAGITQNIPLPVYEELTKLAMGYGDISEQEAKAFIEEFCSKHSITILNDEQSGPAQNVKQCGLCGLINNASNRFCTRCQTELEVLCPSCGHQASSNHQVCGHCSFPIGNMSNVPQTLQRAKQYIHKEDFDHAKQVLHRILDWWPNHPEALKNLQFVEEKETEIQNIIQKMNELFEKKFFYTVRNLFIQHRKLVQTSPSLKSMEKESLSRIHLTQNYVKQANSVPDEERKVELFLKALEISGDCKDAQKFLAKYPPAAPTSLQITTNAEGVALRWKASDAKGPIVYRLLRKKGEESKHPLDGEILQVTADCSFTDRTAEGGYPYYYSIYTVRGSIVSQSSVNQGPIFMRKEVQNIGVSQENNVIELSWTLPKGASYVEVWKKVDGIPAKRTDGKLLNGVTKNGVIDNDVAYGKSYGYLIVAVYEVDGQKIYSEGLTRKSQMIPLPKMLQNLTVTRNKDGIVLNWDKWQSNSDKMHIYYAQKPISLEEGPLALDKVPDYIDKFEVTSEEDHKELLFDHMHVPIYITPIAHNDEVALVGKTFVSKVHPEVRNIRHWVDKNDLVIQWDWPKGINEVVIVCGKDAFSNNPKGSADTTTRVLSKGSYDALNGYKITSETRDYYFTIFTQYEDNGDLVQSNGVNYLCMNSEQVSLLYHIKVNRFFGKGVYLNVSSELPITLPNLVLVKNTNNIPRTKEQGEVILRIASQKINRSETFEIPYKYADKNAYAKLFFENEQDAQKIRLQADGGKDSMCLW